MPFDGIPKVIFGGAGIGALVATKTIYDRADQDEVARPEIHLYEGQQHVGGRAQSSVFSGFVVDNRWFHRGWDNRFIQFILEHYKFYADQGRLTDLRKRFFHDRVSSSVILKGPNELAAGFRGGALEILDRDFRHLERQASASKVPFDISLFDLAHKTKDPRVIDEMELLCTWTGVDPRKVAYREIIEDPAGSGGLLCWGGAAEPISFLVNDVVERGAEIHRNIKITKISRFNDYCIFEDQNDNKYEANAAGVTFSVGVLKHALKSGDIQFWPEPPSQLVRCLGDLEMANMTKIVVAAPEIQQEGRVYFRDGNIIKGFFDAHPGFAPTFSFGGPGALEVEKMKADVKVELISRILRDAGKHPDYELCSEDLHCTGANGNPFTLGAYSILQPYGERHEPINDGPIDYFGEHTAKAKNSPGTMEGTLDAGQKAGNAIYCRLRSHLPTRGSVYTAPAQDNPVSVRL